jgi:hypothetical protein
MKNQDRPCWGAGVRGPRTLSDGDFHCKQDSADALQKIPAHISAPVFSRAYGRCPVAEGSDR